MNTKIIFSSLAHLEEQHMNQVYLNGFKNKDHKLIREFYMKEWPKLRSMILKLGGNEDQAQDIMQNGMLSLYTNIQIGRYSLQQNVKLSSYFLQICKYQWFDMNKSVHHRKTSSINELVTDGLETPEPNADLIIVENERRQQVHRYLNMLDVKCKEILRAFYWRGTSISELGEEYNLTEASAKTTKYRCLKKLKKLINKK